MRWLRLLPVLALLLNCRSWTPAPQVVRPAAASPEITIYPTAAPPRQVPQPEAVVEATIPAQPMLPQPWQGEPAGCLVEDAQAALTDSTALLDYADTLIALDVPLRERAAAGAWNAITGMEDSGPGAPFTIRVGDVKNTFLIQRMLDALHVAGFVTWLRETGRPGEGLHILAIPLVDASIRSGAWAAYVQAYWQDSLAVPPGDLQVRLARKLPPCRWMVARGYAPAVDPGWWPAGSDRWPDYTRAAQKYLAADMQTATQVARAINWNVHLEAANTMCGPLTWSILRDAGAFPPGLGAWTDGPQTFWLAKPTTNGRPWNLFPAGTYRVYHFGTALSRFDFSTFPLVSGDVLYLYSEKDGFDHILIVTETYSDGSVYTVTNLTQQHPEALITVERRLLLHLIDRGVGLARQEWEDRSNGRTGHAGFDVFRWDWVEKDVSNAAAQHIVQPGDTLASIAVRWKTPMGKIAQYNGIDAGAVLVVGQNVFIPPNQWQPLS